MTFHYSSCEKQHTCNWELGMTIKRWKIKRNIKIWLSYLSHTACIEYLKKQTCFFATAVKKWISFKNEKYMAFSIKHNMCWISRVVNTILFVVMYCIVKHVSFKLMCTVVYSTTTKSNAAHAQALSYFLSPIFVLYLQIILSKLIIPFSTK